MPARLILIALVWLCTSCAGTVGQPTLTADDVIRLMEAHNGRGCLDLSGAYPPFGVGRIIAQWGENPPECTR